MQFDWNEKDLKRKLFLSKVYNLIYKDDPSYALYSSMLNVNSNTNSNKNNNAQYQVNKYSCLGIRLSKSIDISNIFFPEFKSLNLTNKDLIVIVHDFFKYYDKEKFKIAEKILRKKHFIEINNYFDTKGYSFMINSNEAYIHLNKDNNDIILLSTLIHEMNHIVSYIEYGNVQSFLNELPSLNSELNLIPFLKCYGFDIDEVNKLDMLNRHDYYFLFKQIELARICSNIMNSTKTTKEAVLKIQKYFEEKEKYIISEKEILNFLKVDNNLSDYVIPFFYTFMNIENNKDQLLYLERDIINSKKEISLNDYKERVNYFNNYTKTLSKKIKN